VAQYGNESDAAAGLQQVNAGTPFAQVATAAGEGSGPQPCTILYGIAGQLGSSLLTLKDNVVSSPIPYANGEYLLLEITSRTPTPFAQAESSVREALGQTGNNVVTQAIERKGHSASVSVNPRYGTWKPSIAQVDLPSTPAAANVLNPAVNDAATATAPRASTSPTGTSG
jgi:hypothetical protein